ncbi:MAG: protein-glutamate O-methyltransferase CheR [Deltaproteobacteria bacterium]|nr:protein-glutamate O-methyltransferase CheR [Deltaproteobacteria bacterium]MCL5879678.1 protein-glutamate O-methyltransferase CheR [Deltaproteobacteria bacterium]MDA8304063.1 protein-glutamate O-methyltransferase CheR [Deltaproteobacteria bacterium]
MEYPNTNLSDEIFYKLKNLIYDISGIYFNEQKKYLLEARLSRRLSILDLPNFEDYYNYLKYSPKKKSEIKELLNSVTTNETSFFRDSPQLDVFMDVLKQIVIAPSVSPNKKIRIWSAGCSTGEEPYTIAMMIKENFPFSNAKFDIIGSDISEHVLDSAKRGIYNDYTLRNASKGIIAKYFNKADNDSFALKDEIKNMVGFYNVNLVDAKEVKNLDIFDIVLCRNVIIYFDDESKKRAISNIYESLKIGGHLFLGHSESLHFISTSFKLVGFGKTPLYRKE